MLIQYYEEIHDVIQKRLDECSDIIEEYYMVRINEFKDNMLSSSQPQEKDITAITDEHHERLKKLRLLYDQFLSKTETEFFDVLKQIRF